MAEIQSLERSARRCVGKGHHLPAPTVGKSHLVLQVRCCNAALIIDERMQI
jgi:hypothetical protein